MLGFQFPSFSLGIDHDLDPSRGSTSCEPVSRPSSSGHLRQLEDDNDFEARVMDSDTDAAADMATPVLKRLRRGLKPESLDSSCNVDDEIEEFSSPERSCVDDCSSAGFQSVCGSSKFPLPRSGALTASHSKVRKLKRIIDTPPSLNLEMSDKKLRFPELTISPLRKFLLVDSDTDDTSVGIDLPRVAAKTNKHSKINQNKAQNGKESVLNEVQGKDLWDDFCSIKTFSVPTSPAMDEASEQYFKGAAPKNLQNKCSDHHQTSSAIQDVDLDLDLCVSPPSHRYFFHHDPKIQKLVRGRLCNFSPLDALKNHGSRQLHAATIDYMEQFNHQEGSKRKGAKSLTRSGKKSKQSDASNSKTLRCSGSAPNNTSAGHWYTASDGSKVYVTKNGEELRGQTAYRHYRKVGVARSERSKKRAPAN